MVGYCFRLILVNDFSMWFLLRVLVLLLCLWSTLAQLIVSIPTDSELITDELVPELDITTESSDSWLSILGDDKIFSYLAHGHDVLDPTIDDPNAERLFQLRESFKLSAKYWENASFKEVEVELLRLNKELEKVYQRLLRFAKVLVSLTKEDMFAITDIIIENEKYLEDMLNAELSVASERDAVESENSWVEVELDDSKDELEDIINNGQIWDLSDEDDDSTLVKTNNIDELTPTEKLKDMVESSGILRKAKKDARKAKLEVETLYKLLKMKKLIQSPLTFVIWSIIKTIEKIKKLLIFIIKTTIYKIKLFIEAFPQEAYWRLRLLIKLFLQILEIIIWDLKYLITEILYRLYFLIKKLGKISISIMIYLVGVVKKVINFDFNSTDEYYLDWEGDNDRKEWVQYDWADEGIKYQQSTTFKSPKEIDNLFEGLFSKEELDEINRDSFNFDIEFAYGENLGIKPYNYTFVAKRENRNYSAILNDESIEVDTSVSTTDLITASNVSLAIENMAAGSQTCGNWLFITALWALMRV